MSDSRINLREIVSQAESAELTAISSFFFSNPEKPLVATGSGAAESVADFAALLYGARGGVGTAVSPYTLNSFSDAALKTSKVLLVSAGGHNNDIAFAAKRCLEVNPDTANFTLSRSDRNEVRKLFIKHGSTLSFDIPGPRLHDGFVSVGTPLQFFALLCKAFNPGGDLGKYAVMPRKPFRLERNDGSPPGPAKGISPNEPASSFLPVPGWSALQDSSLTSAMPQGPVTSPRPIPEGLTRGCRCGCRSSRR